MTGSTKTLAMRYVDDMDDKAAARFPIASARDPEKKRKLKKADFRRAFDILSSLSTRC